MALECRGCSVDTSGLRKMDRNRFGPGISQWPQTLKRNWRWILLKIKWWISVSVFIRKLNLGSDDGLAWVFLGFNSTLITLLPLFLSGKFPYFFILHLAAWNGIVNLTYNKTTDKSSWSDRKCSEASNQYAARLPFAEYINSILSNWNLSLSGKSRLLAIAYWIIVLCGLWRHRQQQRCRLAIKLNGTT